MSKKQELLDYIMSLTPEQAKEALNFVTQWLSEQNTTTETNL